MDYKIVFFDVDGTITHQADGSILDSTKDAIKALINKGIRVVAATGRPLSMCEEIRDLGIDTFITANGAYVKHNQMIIHKVPMDKKNTQEVFDFARKSKHGLSFFTEQFFMNGVKNIEISKALKESLSLNDYPTINQLIYNHEVYLMCLYANDEMVVDYITKFPYLIFKRWHPFILSVLQEDISKSLAAKKVLHFFDIDKSEAIAFGDGENDIDMLELAGVGVAMGNGNDKLKKVANFITKNSNEDGIEFALKKIGIL